MQELMGVLLFDFLERRFAARIGQRVDGQYVVALFQHQIADEGGADEAGAAGNYHTHVLFPSSEIGRKVG